MTEIGVTLYIVVIVFGIVLTIAWIILPFAIIGTKPILRELLRETQRTNELLQRAGASMSRAGEWNTEPPGRIEPR